MIRLALVVTVLAACGSNGDSRHIDDACVAAGSNTMTFTESMATYACHEPFKGVVTFTNNSCDPISVTGITIHTDLVSGTCTIPADYTYQPQGSTTVAVGATNTVLNLTASDYCCTPTTCPATFDCDEKYTMTVLSSGGNVSASQSVHLTLGGCDVVCQ
jgi:hypothetical protein